MSFSELTVCIVEDDDFQRQMIARMLTAMGVGTVCDSDNGREALERTCRQSERPVDIVICDLSMPEMDGLEFMRHLAQGCRHVAVIVMTAHGDMLLVSAVTMARMYGLRVLGALEKPFAAAQLKELLAKYIRQDGEADEAELAPSFTLEEILQGIHAKQFEPYFQPKSDLHTGCLLGAEALARWIHPQLGIIGPHVFIPLLERSGNIDELTFHMIEQAASACRTFHEQGHLVHISVNLSLVSLGDPELADKIVRLVHQAGVDPYYIMLEVTETAAMTEVAHALENLARLSLNGFGLSLDDYGTGYSSLQQLTRIPFGELKIDQSFVKGFTHSKASGIVVESSIQMAHKLKIRCLAEGVESKQDWDALTQAGCDVAQGYFIANPMNARDFLGFMDAYRCSRMVAPQASGSSLHILVVDDDEFTRKLLVKLLHEIGYGRVTDTDSAESALQLFEEHSFELIISDIQMPGTNGLEFIGSIRAGKTHARPDTKIVVLTSYSSTAILGAALALDVNGFLVKPITPAAIDEKLAVALHERFHLRSPFAYEAVKTQLNDVPAAVDTQQAAGAATTGIDRLRSTGRSEWISDKVNERGCPLHSLRPGMMLKEDIHLQDGTLLLSAGHVLSDVAIGCLHDLAGLLPKKVYTVKEAAGS